MYNRYIPDDASYSPVQEENQNSKAPEGPRQETNSQPSSGQFQRPAGSYSPPGPRQAPGQQNPFGIGGFKLPSFLNGKDGLGSLLSGKDGLGSLFSGKERGGLSSLLKTLKLDDIDTGDILLLLIILYLLVEGDDLELVIALGLVLLMGFGDSVKGEEPT